MKIAVVVAALWVLSPIDLIPEFLRVIGPLADVIVVALLPRYAAGSVPRHILLEAWRGNPQLIQRLLGPPRPVTTEDSPCSLNNHYYCFAVAPRPTRRTSR